MEVLFAEIRPLLPAEEAILPDLRDGRFATLGGGARPERATDDNTIRATFLRLLLLLREDQDFRPHEKGVQVAGAWIVGSLDLEGCRIPRGIVLRNCHLEGPPLLRGAIVDRLLLDGSSLPGLRAEGLEVRGGVALVGAQVDGEIVMPGARLGGSLVCDRAHLSAPLGTAISAGDLTARAVLLRGARIDGRVTLTGAQLRSDLNATGLRLSQPGDVALDADGIDVQGDIVLRGAEIDGEARFIGGHVAGDFDGTGSTLRNPGKDALQVNRAVIKGGFFLRDKASIIGTLDMTGAVIGTIHDELACWPGKGDLLLNRCLYDAFIDGPVDAASRLEWLALQNPERWGQDFWPQPYEQLANVFSAMGHEGDARAVLVAKERLYRRAQRARTKRPVWRAVLGVTDGILAVTVLYGRQPLLAFVWLGFFWAMGVLVFGVAEHRGAFKPASPVVLRSPEWTLCSFTRDSERVLTATQQPTRGRAEPGQSQLDCFRAQWETASYPPFNAWMYSLDTLFPVLEIDQKEYWRPDQTRPWGGLAKAYFYLQSIVGWALSLLAVAGFSGLVKSR